MFLLIIFAIKELMDIIVADVYYEEEFTYQEVLTIGGGSHRVEISDFCYMDDAYYFIGSAVRLGDYKGGRDGIVIKYSGEVEWIKSYGGMRDDFFLGCYCDTDIYIVGNTYSTNFLGNSPNFLTGYYLLLNAEGEMKESHVIPYPLDIYPTSIWKGNDIKIAGYLDNVGNKDIFLYDQELTVFEHTGVDKIYSVEGELGFGSTTSKEFLAQNINPAIYNFSTDTFEVYSSPIRGELYSANRGYIGERGITYEDGFILQDDVPLLINNSIKAYVEDAFYIQKEYEILFTYDQEPIVHTLYTKEGVYLYDEYQMEGYIVFNNLREEYLFTHNIEKETYYQSFVLLFSGSGVLNGNEIESGTKIGVGDYTFVWNDNPIHFSVLPNDVNLQLFQEYENAFVEESVLNKKLILIPLIIIGNLLYKKYQI